MRDFFPLKNQSYSCHQKRGGMRAKSKQVSSEAYSSGEQSMVQPFLPSHFPLLNRRRKKKSLYFILHVAPK